MREIYARALEELVLTDDSSWVKILNIMLAAGYTPEELQWELAASPRTWERWMAGQAPPREMARRLLRNSLAESLRQQSGRTE